jgi:DNA polymerase III epsilon subunit-like protein
VGPNVKRQWGLKTLCRELLGVDIQQKSRRGHDSVEDAFAAREVVLWCINNTAGLEVWADQQRAIEEEKVQARNLKNARRRQIQAEYDFQGLEDDYYSRDSQVDEFLVGYG